MDSLTSKWAYSVEGADVALPGREIQISNAEVFAKIMRLNELRNFLIVEGAFPCRHCLSFKQHVNFTYFVIVGVWSGLPCVLVMFARLFSIDFSVQSNPRACADEGEIRRSFFQPFDWKSTIVFGIRRAHKGY